MILISNNSNPKIYLPSIVPIVLVGVLHEIDIDHLEERNAWQILPLCKNEDGLFGPHGSSSPKGSFQEAAFPATDP
jgi:hypothetical protein